MQCTQPRNAGDIACGRQAICLLLPLGARMMPSLQVFFLALPASVLLGMLMLFVTIVVVTLIELKLVRDSSDY